MDQLAAHLEEITIAIDRHGLDCVPGATALGAAMIDHAPVLAEVLISSCEPLVARERAFGRTVALAQRLAGAERARVESVLSFSDASVLEIPAAARVTV